MFRKQRGSCNHVLIQTLTVTSLNPNPAPNPKVLHEIKKCVDVCLSAVAQGEGGLFGGLETKEDVIPYAKRATRREAYMAGKGGASEFN